MATIRRPSRQKKRRSKDSGGFWISFSDLMSCLLLIFVLIMFYIMYQYFDMYEINMAEIARQQYDLDEANATLTEQQERLSAQEQEMIAQQIRLNAAQADLQDAESILAQQQEKLKDAQALLQNKEDELARQQATLQAQENTLSQQRAKLEAQEATLSEQQATLSAQEATLTEQEATLSAQAATLSEQAEKLSAQEDKLDSLSVQLAGQQTQIENQQRQIEQLVGVRTRIITDLSNALRSSNINATVDPANGSIALESDVLFPFGSYKLSDAGKEWVDAFLPVYLDVLFSEQYQPYIAEVIIEGHTDSVGGYLSNLMLSQQRALAVAAYVLSDDYRAISAKQRNLFRQLATVNGRSYMDHITVDGVEDSDASRRVVFKFRLTDEEMISQMRAILEN